MISGGFAIGRGIAALTLCLSPLLHVSCTRASPITPKQSSQANRSPTPAVARLVAYLFEGQVWTLSPGAPDSKPVAVPMEDPVDEYLWSSDGRFLYLVVGLRVIKVSVNEWKGTEIGPIAAPAGTTLDRLETSWQPGLMIIHTSDADAASHIYSFSLERSETVELTVDQYASLRTIEAPTVQEFADLAVSPDLTRVLFKGTVGSSEQLFVADLESGFPVRIGSLESIDGFEESADLEGGHRILAAEWSPDSRFVLFNPAQSCSESGLCYGQLFLVDSWSGNQRRLSQGMMVGLDVNWDKKGNNLLFEDAGKIMLTSVTGEPRVLAEGNRPRWQPIE